MSPAIDGLTRSQLAAVTHPGGPLLVRGRSGHRQDHRARAPLRLARGAGRRPRRRARARAVGARPSRRCAGALEALVEPPYEELRVDTFRSFCARLLRDEAMEAGLDPAFAPVTRADRVALLLDCISELRLRHHEIGGNPAAAARRASWRGSTGSRRRWWAPPSCWPTRRRAPRRAATATTPPARARPVSWSSPASTPTTSGCWASAAPWTPATSCCAPSGCCTSARMCASAPRAASATCSWTSTRT